MEGTKNGQRGQNPVTVLGAGTMGHGLALLAARAGHRVWLVDLEEQALRKARELLEAETQWLEAQGELGGLGAQDVLRLIRTTRALEESLEDSVLILEAVSEDVSVKRQLYEAIAPKLSPKAILASNTSYLDVFSIAPEELLERFLIAHFYAPPHLIPLVEVVPSPKTSPGVLEELLELLRSWGQKPVLMKKFIPGYIVNRLQRAMAREIFHLLDEGYATPEQIDEAVKASLGIRIPVVGVVQRYDFTGLDLALKFLGNPSIQLVNEDRIPASLMEKVKAGDLGVKTGRGFYVYTNSSTAETLLERDRRLLYLRRFLESL
jgi:3-hydroxybutyryl-CoA dehydrogenase